MHLAKLSPDMDLCVTQELNFGKGFNMKFSHHSGSFKLTKIMKSMPKPLHKACFLIVEFTIQLSIS